MWRRRWRLRTQILLVAALATALGGAATLYRRHRRFYDLAAYHARKEVELLRSITPQPLPHYGECGASQHTRGEGQVARAAGGAGGIAGTSPPAEDDPDDSLTDRQLEEFFNARVAQAAWHDEMRQKYLRASTRPWWPVAPDPPVPLGL